MRCWANSTAAVVVAFVALLAANGPLLCTAYEHNMLHDPQPRLHQEPEPEIDRATFPFTEHDRRAMSHCALCHQVLVPALHKAIVESDSETHTMNFVRSVLRPLPFMFTFDSTTNTATRRMDPAEATKLASAVADDDDEDYGDAAAADPLVLHAVEHLLWDHDTARRISALVRVYHEMHDRQELIDELIEHQVCACDAKNIERTDARFAKLLVRHSHAVDMEYAAHPPVTHTTHEEAQRSAEIGRRDEATLRSSVEALQHPAFDEF